MLLYYLDLLGVAVFAATGVLAARDRDLDLFGVLIVATVTAIGGGTLRDILLNRHPIFWIVDTAYLSIIAVAAGLTVIYLRWRPPPRKLLLIADALGLGLFALSGAKLAIAAGHPALIAIVMGTMSGVTGGVVRDVLTARVPLVLQREIYATAAMVGIAIYLILAAWEVSNNTAFGIGFAAVVILRLLAIKGNVNLPVVR